LEAAGDEGLVTRLDDANDLHVSVREPVTEGLTECPVLLVVQRAHRRDGDAAGREERLGAIEIARLEELVEPLRRLSRFAHRYPSLPVALKHRTELEAGADERSLSCPGGSRRGGTTSCHRPPWP